jgi:hypothetical protein
VPAFDKYPLEKLIGILIVRMLFVVFAVTVIAESYIGLTKPKISPTLCFTNSSTDIERLAEEK